MQNYKIKITRLVIWLAFLTTFISGQEQMKEEEPIKIETRVVFVDVLVRDKATRRPVVDLNRENFKLTVDGKSREIENFGLDGFERCPLTLMLYFNLAPNGALRYLKQPQTQKSLAEALAKLRKDDEVGVIAAEDWFVGSPQILVKPTRNWAEVSKSIGEAVDDAKLDGQTKPDNANKRTMTEAIAEVEKIAAENPERQVALVYISDGVNTLDTMNFDDRKNLAARLLKNNISFSALNFNLLSGYSAAANIINPLAYVFGASVTGSANYLAEQSGGISIKVEKAEDFGASLEEIFNLYGSRYALGFALDETEKDDGKLHKLEVKVKDKRRKLLINTRRGFYIARRPQ